MNLRERVDLLISKKAGSGELWTPACFKFNYFLTT
jgi:hypothetical protein